LAAAPRDEAALPAVLTIAGVGLMVLSFFVGLLGVGSGYRRVSQPTGPAAYQTLATSAPPTDGGAEKSTSSPTDLLALVNTNRDVPLPDVFRAGDKVTIRSRGGFTCAVIPYDVPRNYQLDIGVISRSGDGLLIGFPIGGRRAMFTIDGFTGEPPDGKMRTALETIDGFRPHERGYGGQSHYGQLLKRNIASTITVRVVDKTIMLSCDGRQVLQWSGEPSRLAIYGAFNQGPPQRMFIGSWAATYEVASLRLTRL
jgi:hypothetical protein